MTCLNSVPIGALLKNKDVQLPHEPNTLFRGPPRIKMNNVFRSTLSLDFWETLSQTLSWSLKTHWVPFELEAGTTQPFLTSCVFGNNLAWNWWKHSFWYQTNLTFTAWCVKCQPQKKTIESSAFGISVAWYSWKHTFARPNKSYLQNMLCQPQKALETSVFGIGVACNSCKRSSGNE